MGRFLTIVLVAAGASCGPASEPPHSIGDLAIANRVFVEPVMPDASSLYFTVTNHGTVEDTLVSVSVPFAAGSGIHDVVRDGDQMHMVPVAGVPIPPGATVRLAPGGLHVMLTGLTRVPTRDERVEVILAFRRAGSDSVSFAVVPYAQVEERLGRDRTR